MENAWFREDGSAYRRPSLLGGKVFANGPNYVIVEDRKLFETIIVEISKFVPV